MRPAGHALVERNPDLALHHMHDPVQDRLMIARMTYFRVKFVRLPGPYRAFLDSCLAPGGTVVLVDCTLSWPTTTVGDRHVFQFGAPGGLAEHEFREGSPRVAQFLRQQGSSRDGWRPPAADGISPEAEWGFAEPLAEDVAALAANRGARLERLRFEEPEDLSPLIADLFRDWYAGHGLPDGRLLVSSFLLMDPMLTMRTGSVPYWALFGTRPSLERLVGYLSRAAGYDEIRLTIFPHGVDSIGLPGIGEWQAVLGLARQHGELLAVDPGRYPRHFRALTGLHRKLNRLPHGPAVPPLEWDAARHYLAPHAAAHKEAGEQAPGPLTKADAAKHIEELQKRTGGGQLAVRHLILKRWPRLAAHRQPDHLDLPVRGRAGSCRGESTAHQSGRERSRRSVKPTL